MLVPAPFRSARGGAILRDLVEVGVLLTGVGPVLELDDAELRERQEFAFEAAVRMRDRFLQQEVWERMGIDPRPVVTSMLSIPPEENMFQQLLFSKIVPNCKKLGLLDASGGWLRRRFEELGVIQFEDWADTGEEYAALDEVAKDRAASG